MTTHTYDVRLVHHVFASPTFFTERIVFGPNARFDEVRAALLATATLHPGTQVVAIYNCSMLCFCD